MKRFYLFLCIATHIIGLYAQIPQNYYNNADGYCGASLKTALHQVINSHKALSYDELWQAFETTDRRPDGKVWDIYSSKTNYIFGEDQAGNYSQEGDVYNREHSFPKSWFNDDKPMYSDLFHLYPSDGYVNGRRSNYPFGETDKPDYSSYGGFSKLGPSSTPGYSGKVFEPADEFKGDLARTYFYMATCYENLIAGWKSPMLAGNKYPAYTSWTVNMLLKWAEEDPVSQKEIDRNNAVYKLQGNRNPYIDFPGLEQYIWGDKMEIVFDPENYEGAGEPGETPVFMPTFSPSGGTITKGTLVRISTKTPGAQIVYTLDNNSQTVSGNPTELIINETTSITAFAQLNGKQSSSATATFTVTDDGGETPPVSGKQRFSPVNSTHDLIPGSQYLIVCQDKSVAMGAPDSDIRSHISIQIKNGQIETEVNGENQPRTFVLGYTGNLYTLFDNTENSYLSLNSDKNKLHGSTDKNSPNILWEINISGNNTDIRSNSYPERKIQYNTSAPRFACYSSEQTAVTLYKMADEGTDIGSIQYEAENVDVYSIHGILLRKNVTYKEALKNLPAGIYLINGRKIIVK